MRVKNTGLVLVVGGALVSLLAVFIYVRSLLDANQADPRIIFGSAVPEQLKVLSALNLEGGIVGEFFDSNSRHKLSLIRVGPAPSNGESSVKGVLDVVDNYRRDASAPSSIHPLISKYILAQFNTMSADKARTVHLTVGERGVEAEAFETTHEANYLLGVLNANNQQQFLFLAMRKGQAVDATFVGDMLQHVKELQIARG